MRLGELTAGLTGLRRGRAGRRARPTSRSPRSPTTAAPCTGGALFFCVPRLPGRRARLRARRRSRAARSRWSSSARSGSACPEVERRVGARRDGAAGGALLRRPDRASCSVVGVTGTNGKTTTAFLVRALLEAARRAVRRCWAPSSRSSAATSARWSARPPRRSTCSATSARCSTAATRLRDGGLLARAGAAPRRRDPLRRGDLHEPDAGPPRLPPDDGGLLPRQAAAVLPPTAAGAAREVVNVDDPYGRRLAAELAGRRHVRGRRARPTTARPTCAAASAAARFTLRTAEGERAAELPLPGRFNVANALGALAAAHRARRADWRR